MEAAVRNSESGGRKAPHPVYDFCFFLQFQGVLVELSHIPHVITVGLEDFSRCENERDKRGEIC
jgi:hypothetical protein